MPERSVDIVRGLWQGVADLLASASADAPLERVLEAPETQDSIAAMLARIDPELELDLTHFTDWLEESVYRGREGMLRFWRDYLSAWAEIKWEFEEFIEAGDHVVVLQRQRARGRSSGAVTIYPQYATVWRLRDGMVTHLAAYSDRAAALEVAGIEPG